MKFTKKQVDVLKDFILVIEDSLSKETCSELLRVYHNRAIDWVPARTGGDLINPDVRNCSTIGLSLPCVMNNPTRQRLHEDIRQSAGKVLKTYQKYYPDLHAQQDTGYDLLRYTKGGFYHQHTDSFTEILRSLSCSWALNDNYEGGEWGFFDGQLKLKVKAGSAVLFPSNFMYPHEICEVKKGTRYSIVTWFQ
jgi:predicted 2-oxoglutarate/Fe(II)-dependent dioxygenase YbiX